MPKINFDITNRWDGKVIFTAEIECEPDASIYTKMGLAVVVALKRGADLYGADLYGADLRSADLYGANLRSANLCGANLYGANLCGANLCGANLCGANLRSANLYGANLRSADLRSADLYGANLRSANLCGANLYGADLRSADLGGADLGGADLRSANLRSADLGGADLGGANLRGANLRGADLGGQWIIQGGTRSDGYPFFLQMLTGDKEPMVKAGCRHFTLSEAEAHWKATRWGTPLFAETDAIVRSMVALAAIREFWPVAAVEATEAAINSVSEAA